MNKTNLIISELNEIFKIIRKSSVKKNSSNSIKPMLSRLDAYVYDMMEQISRGFDAPNEKFPDLGAKLSLENKGKHLKMELDREFATKLYNNLEHSTGLDPLAILDRVQDIITDTFTLKNTILQNFYTSNNKSNFPMFLFKSILNQEKKDYVQRSKETPTLSEASPEANTVTYLDLLTQNIYEDLIDPSNTSYEILKTNFLHFLNKKYPVYFDVVSELLSFYSREEQFVGQKDKKHLQVLYNRLPEKTRGAILKQLKVKDLHQIQVQLKEIIKEFSNEYGEIKLFEKTDTMPKPNLDKFFMSSDVKLPERTVYHVLSDKHIPGLLDRFLTIKSSITPSDLSHLINYISPAKPIKLKEEFPEILDEEMSFNQTQVKAYNRNLIEHLLKHLSNNRKLQAIDVFERYNIKFIFNNDRLVHIYPVNMKNLDVLKNSDETIPFHIEVTPLSHVFSKLKSLNHGQKVTEEDLKVYEAISKPVVELPNLRHVNTKAAPIVYRDTDGHEQFYKQNSNMFSFIYDNTQYLFHKENKDVFLINIKKSSVSLNNLDNDIFNIIFRTTKLEGVSEANRLEFILSELINMKVHEGKISTDKIKTSLNKIRQKMVVFFMTKPVEKTELVKHILANEEIMTLNKTIKEYVQYKENPDDEESRFEILQRKMKLPADVPTDYDPSYRKRKKSNLDNALNYLVTSLEKLSRN